MIETPVAIALAVIFVLCVTVRRLRAPFFGFVAITALLTLVKLATCFLKAPAGGDPGASFFAGPESYFLAGVSGVIVAIVLGLTIIDRLMRFRPVAEGVILQAWDYAQRKPKGSHVRLELEKAILRLGRNTLGLKRVRSAKGVVDRVNGVEKMKKPAFDGPRVVVDNDGWKEAA